MKGLPQRYQPSHFDVQVRVSVGRGRVYRTGSRWVTMETIAQRKVSIVTHSICTQFISQGMGHLVAAAGDSYYN